ncbi:helix-turn-helix domain-containing protein [Capnocytophaga sp. G2]|uniref:helix-turn-helix domain-containing protein n=1 Tax=Capnocytophaga sp. G2 TaxID=3110695 RepID=UPI002B4A28C2|nr:helix-turn-helix domain-containing protein [Capnocytophaga sp. G2]MEB3005603.1 helix-turn-helix domain-containing protein [Capnocytophaga sp. G2]
MDTIQFIQTSPEQLQAAIIEGVRKELNELKKDFQPKEPTVYLSRQEVKQMLGINLTTLNNWTKKGILTSYGIGGRVYYKRHEVEKAIIQLQTA